MQRREVVAAALSLSVKGASGSGKGAPLRAQSTPGIDNGPNLTELERISGVTAVDSTFAPGDVRRYGAAGSGRSDDSPAWRIAIATGHRVLGGGPEQIYRLDSHIPVGRATIIDMQGATIKIAGNSQAFVRNPAAPTASSEAIGALQGSRSLTLASSTGFSRGQWIRLSFNDYPQHDASSYPPSWARIVDIRGRVAQIDTPLQLTYSNGNVLAMAYDPDAFLQRFECRNGIFDGSACTWDRDTGQAIRIGATEYVIVGDCEFRNFRNNGKLTCAIELFTIIDARVSGCRFTGSVSNFDMCDIQDARSAHFTENMLEGSHFGCNITRVDYGLFSSNSMHGQRNLESDNGLAIPRSVRGLKAYGCTAIRILGNHVSDYESPVKVEACFRYEISNNMVFNAGLSPFNGQIALNVGSIIRGRNMGSGQIIANHVENCGGIGIGITSDPVGGVIVSGNIVRSTQSVAMHVGVSNATIIGNRIEDWDMSGHGDPGIRFGNGATIADNRFSNSSGSTAPCLAGQHLGGANEIIRDNISETGNPLV